MSKGHPQKSHTPITPSEPADATPQTELSQVSDTRRQVEWYRECPHCWATMGGVGVAYKTMPEDNSIGTRYYKCDVCGTSFSRDFEVAYEMVTKRVVTIIKR
jgi:hypothetical protein